MNKSDNVSLLHKIIACSLAGILSSYVIKRFNQTYLPGWLPRVLIPFVFLFLLVTPILFIPVWQFQERKNKIPSTSVLAFFQAVIIYFAAVDFTKWALLKFLHLHMTTSLGWMEMPMTMLTGEQQISHFFGQNYPMVVAFGICEMTGAVLILFRKTRLLGAFILFVMSVNIALMDFLYGVKDPFPEICLLLCSVTYIALLDYKKIIHFFFRAGTGLPKISFKNRLIKDLLRISAIAIPLLILLPNYKVQYRPGLTGKYQIVKMTVNGKALMLDSCSNNAFANVYFDLGDYFVFASHDFTKRQVGHFEFNQTTRQFTTIWQYPKGCNDTLFAKVSPLDNRNRMTLSGIMAKDTLHIELLKKEVTSVTKTY